MLIVFAYRDGNTTPPTLPGDWTNIASSGASSSSSRVGYRVLQGGDTLRVDHRCVVHDFL